MHRGYKSREVIPTHIESHRVVKDTRTTSRSSACRLLRERNLLPELQSAYRAYHSTETAVLRVVSDIFEALDRGDWAALTLLDISAAFDTVDHKTINTSKTKELIICYSKKVNVNDINIKNCSLSKC